MRFILIHGYKSSPEKNFFPWLISELRSRGHEVIAPTLPDPENPQIDAWLELLKQETRFLKNDTVIYGHSIGAAAALRFLEMSEAASTPRACVLSSPPLMVRKPESLQAFFMSDFDFDVLMWKASEFYVIHSKDDAVVPFSHGEKYAERLHATLIATESDGHFDGAKYPVILDTLLKAASPLEESEPGSKLQNDYTGIDFSANLSQE
ncbi:MAG: hypothetical protein ACD_76C00121G0005 [uncultured bacterium]|nr:MAG: hypothetical protein ACD_76C00121G0005 [uncultured bacterium]